jgi:hypothetical protein
MLTLGNGNQKEIRYDPIQIKRTLKRKIAGLKFTHELEIRVIASALIELALADPDKVEEICKRLKMNKER